jgi:hypothetical protein
LTVPQDGGWGDAPPLWWRDMPGKKCAFPKQCLSVFFTISNTQKHTNVITKGITRGQLRSRLHSQQWRKWNPICCTAVPVSRDHLLFEPGGVAWSLDGCTSWASIHFVSGQN